MISFDDFKKLDLRIGKIVSAEKVSGSEKLLKLLVDFKNEKKQIVAGISKFYKSEDLIGKEIVVVFNLEPRTIFGLESQGMLLAANVDGKAILLTPDKEVPPGTKIT